MTGTSVTSTLFLGVLEVLHSLGCRHLFVRNHEGYPSAFTGDVDVYVELDRLLPGIEELRAACQNAGWEVMREVRRPWVLVLQCVRGDAGAERKVMVLEFFDRFNWLAFPYVEFDEIWEFHRHERNIDVVPSELGMVLTLSHYLYWAGFFPRKYQERMRMAARAPGFEAHFDRVFPGETGRRVRSWLAGYLERGPNEWQQRLQVPEPLAMIPATLVQRARLAAVLRTFRRRPLMAARAVVSVAVLKLGEFVRVRGRALLVERRGWDLLVEVKRVHLYKNRNTIHVQVDDAGPLRLLLVSSRIYWAMSRGGLCIVEAADFRSWRVRLLRGFFGRHLRELPSSGCERGGTEMDRAITVLR